jgi:HSP20 family protein
MALNPLTPFRFGSPLTGTDPFQSLHREINRLFDDMWRAPARSGTGAETAAGTLMQPSMNVSETDGELRITVELPGVAAQDLDVNLQGDLLSIRGEKRFEQSKGDEKENFHFVERSYGSFQRSIRLPFAAEPDQVKARFENGVLSLTLPKPQDQKRARKIQIEGGADKSSGAESQGEGGTMH